MRQQVRVALAHGAVESVPFVVGEDLPAQVVDPHHEPRQHGEGGDDPQGGVAASAVVPTHLDFQPHRVQ